MIDRRFSLHGLILLFPIVRLSYQRIIRSPYGVFSGSIQFSLHEVEEGDKQKDENRDQQYNDKDTLHTISQETGRKLARNVSHEQSPKSREAIPAVRRGCFIPGMSRVFYEPVQSSLLSKDKPASQDDK